ncbi:MAG: preprotein translocase subunit SecG [Verrucomicrobia bacterium]|nr:MAG: preprotein translocase subunit SecG [Verrucomicrobiota bacterium]
MGFLIGLFTFVMVLDCIVLIFLVLIQLPKKEAGAGLAFGGSATDALFGAGKGNVLTNITKYAAGIFFGLAILLAVMQKNYHGRNVSAMNSLLRTPGPITTMPASGAPPASSSTAPANEPAATNVQVTPVTSTNLPAPKVESTNLPASSTNTAPK